MAEAARIQDQGATAAGGASMTAVPGTGESRPPAERPEPRVVEVRRNAALAGAVGVVAAAVSIAYLGRATTTGALLDWVLTGVTAVFAVAWLWSLVDARTPLLVADAHGVRVRLGRTWEGLPWRGLDRVEHHPRRGLGRDGRLVLVPEATTPLLDGLDRTGRRHASLASRLHGAPFAVPLGLATRLSGVRSDEVAEVLRALAGSDAEIVEVRTDTEAAETEAAEAAAETAHTADTADTAVADRDTTAEPEQVATEHTDVEVVTVEDVDQVEDEDADHEVAERRRTGDPRPAIATLIGSLAARVGGRRDAADPDRPEVAEDHEDLADLDDVESDADIDTDTEAAARAARDRDLDGVVEPAPASETPEPLRERRTASRAEVQREGERVAPTAAALPESRELRRSGSVDLVEDSEVWGARVRPIARGGEVVDPIVLDDFSVEPASDPVIGPELAAARTRLSLTVDQLAERTRIRPHVIESIEVDDFAPCGGDFYARGHLRTLARVLGVDSAPLLERYDARYADAPIDPRRVFAAELATGAHGSIRGTRGGPSWTMLVAAVMVVVLAWSIARLVMDDPVELQPTPQLNGSAGPPAAAPVAPPVPVVVTAVQGGASVTVRDGFDEIRYSGDLAMGESTELEITPPVRIEASDGGAIETVVDGRNTGRLGEAGQPASDTLVPD